ncbi:MAG: cell envelope biosis protein OmpA, partial [Labilithrix sp.]|nr:cell envelope biosis protein OmpA [Labilithrix sp.]
MVSVLRSRALTVSLAALLALAAGEGLARAEADTFGLGSGHDGPLVVTSNAGQVINTYAPVTGAVPAGATSVTVGARVGAAASFTPGQLVMIWQARGGFTTPPVSGSAAALTLTTASRTGRYEIGRVASVAGAVVTLTHPVVNAFDALDTQLVSVPEHTTVTVNAGARLVARPWDGASGTGGVLAFLATGAVANAGALDVSGAGFRGGARITSPGSPKGCAAEDGVPGLGTLLGGGAHKGEGLDRSAFSTDPTYVALTPRVFGRGNVATSGGGGDCFNGGGGGGGNGGAGGHGGDTNPEADNGISRPVGGRGGVAASFEPSANLVLGAGGGAGEDDDGVGGPGGGGGGVLWMRAGSLTGAGIIDADGAAGVDAGTSAGDARFSDG